ncbi:MAG: dihydropteroate synthase [Actinomycetota bacterium]|nr:dihydropteroate synthase [Actinomycetota bacterium]
MLVIGEKINIMSKTIGPAMKERDPEPIRQMAHRQVEGGANVLDINLGPATKNGPEMMEFVVRTVQETVPDIRLCLDTMNPDAMAAGLALCNLQPIINSTSAERARLETFLPLAKEYGADIIGLAMTEAGVSRDANERLMAATEIMGAMMEFDVPLERLYLDPLLLPIAVAQQQAAEAIESIAMFKQLNEPPLKTVVGLSNIYNGCPEHVKSPLAAALLALLIPVGLDAAIMDPNDELQMAVVNQDQSVLAADTTVEKSMAVLRNETLYCNSYLD